MTRPPAPSWSHPTASVRLGVTSAGPSWGPPPPRRPRSQGRGSRLVGVTLVAVLLVGAVFGLRTTGLLDLVATAVPAETPATPAVSASPASPTASPSPTAPADTVVAGFDYTISTTSQGVEEHWPCDQPIGVALVLDEDTPPGATDAFTSAVVQLRDASGLPLAVVDAPRGDDSGLDTGITVAYAPLNRVKLGTVIEHDTVLGTTRTDVVAEDGRILRAIILIRSDMEHADPANDFGREVVLHELAHAVGLGHADPESGQVMSPSIDPVDPKPELRPGDRHALSLVGCPASAG